MYCVFLIVYFWLITGTRLQKYCLTDLKFWQISYGCYVRFFSSDVIDILILLSLRNRVLLIFWFVKNPPVVIIWLRMHFNLKQIYDLHCWFILRNWFNATSICCIKAPEIWNLMFLYLFNCFFFFPVSVLQFFK